MDSHDNDDGVNEDLPRFALLKLEDNPGGWGPCSMPEQFKDMPYQPFGKDTRLGKIADWSGSTYQDYRNRNKYASQFGVESHYAYHHELDETSFQLVDTVRVQKTAFQKQRMRFNAQRLRREREKRLQIQSQMNPVLNKMQKNRERDRQRMARRWNKQYGRNVNDYNRRFQRTNREASVQVQDTWVVKEEMDFLRLSKLSLPEIKDPEDLRCCGELEYYDKTYDRVTTRTEKPLQRVNRIIHTVTTTEDPIIRQLAKQKQGNVFATDAILSTIMCCGRSVNSWDIIVQKVGDSLFIDKRNNSDFDFISVSETAIEPPSDEPGSLNSAKNLALEATYINHNFSQQVLRMNDEELGKHSFKEENPFQEGEKSEEMASVGYRYRRFTLGNNIQLVVRCEHDAVLQGPNGETQFINIKALNEWDSRFSGGVDWRAKLDSQRGAVLASELKNNAFKLAKWTVCSLLAGSDQIKFGYVSRVNPKDSSKHVILGTQQFKPVEFANQINLNMDNAWGILRCVIDFFMKQDPGKYLIMKDPNKSLLLLYSLPSNAFESDDEDEDEDDDGDDDDSDKDDDEE